MENYNEQAKNFLDKTETKIKKTFFDYAKHFDDDREKRFIFDIEIARGSRSFSFKYAGSIADVEDHLNRGKVRSKYQKANISESYIEIMPRWRARSIAELEELKRRIVRLNCKLIKKPSDFDILACLTKSDPESFDDFCANYGYSSDSIKANKVYLAVKREYSNLCLLYNDQELSELSEIS